MFLSIGGQHFCIHPWNGLSPSQRIILMDIPMILPTRLFQGPMKSVGVMFPVGSKFVTPRSDNTHTGSLDNPEQLF
jgi:hypothetical protein